MKRVTVRGRGRRAFKHVREDRYVSGGSTARTLGSALSALKHRLERGRTETEKMAETTKLVMSSMYGKFGVHSPFGGM